MREKQYWSGKCSELYNKLLDIAYDHGISTTDKFYPKNAIVLAKKFNDIKSNLESIGIFIGKILPRREDGQHYFIKKSKSSTSSTVLQEACNNEGLRTVDEAVNAVDGVSTTATSTADKACVYAETVDDVDTVDEIEPFGGAFTEVTTVSDDEFPKEWRAAPQSKIKTDNTPTEQMKLM